MPLPEDQYHHYIPRFILRRFKLPNPPTPPKRNNRKRRGRQINNQEEVYFYDLGTGKLETRPIAKVYGIVNLYKDARNPENAHHLEEKLSVLENQAAIVIRKIHDSVGDGSFQIERRDLDALRKFIQIMCYRKQTFYFDEDHPENAPAAGFLKNLREEKGLDNPIEVWLHFLDYFLNTPHNDIVNRAAEFQKRDGIGAVFQSMLGLSNSTAEDLIANDYNHLADHFYIGVVEAAPGTEFIMSNNTFGLWEGRMDRIPDAHRLFVVSPRIALILRSNLLSGDLPLSRPMVVRSSLIGIPLQRVQIRYANGRRSMTMEELLRHRASPAGQRDQVRFKIAKLTEQQTQNVNIIVLINARRDGSITFLSKGVMRKALESYMDLSHPFVVETKHRYLALMDQLADEDSQTPSDRNIETSGASQHSDHRNMDPSDSLTSLSELEGALPEIISGADDGENKRIKTLLNDIDSGKISCKSDYDRAYQVFRVASMEEDAGRYVLTLVEMLLPVVVDRAMRLKEEAIKSRNGITHVNPYAELVQTLPVNHSAKVMATVKGLFPDAPVPPYDDPEIKDVLYDALIVGLLDGFTMEWSFVFPALFPGISLLR